METVQSVGRAFAMLREVAESPGGLSDLARRLDLPTSTTGRLLATLEEIGGVARSDGGTYRIGPAIAELARSAVDDAPSLELAARHHLGALADLTGEAAGLSVVVGDETVSVAQVDAPKPVQAEDWTGHAWPLHRGGSGHAVLSTFDEGELSSYLDRNPDLDRDEVTNRVARAAADGHGWSNGDYREGLSSVAAPVVDHRGRAMGTLYVFGPSYRFPGDEAARLEVEALVRAHARDLSSGIGPAASDRIPDRKESEA
ncbi:MAG: IclR family transcriptional regulator [Actinomycetota bacterium]